MLDDFWKIVYNYTHVFLISIRAHFREWHGFRKRRNFDNLIPSAPS